MAPVVDSCGLCAVADMASLQSRRHGTSIHVGTPGVTSSRSRLVPSEPKGNLRAEAAIRLSTRIKIAVALWFAAEALAFYWAAELIGFPEALLICFITSLFGWTLLKRAGAAAAVKLRAFLDGRRVVDGDPHRFADETLASLGALALLLPGFLSDAVGLVLAIPAARDRIAGRFGTGSIFRPSGAGRERRPGPPTIDLEPGEWRHGEVSRHPASKT